MKIRRLHSPLARPHPRVWPEQGRVFLFGVTLTRGVFQARGGHGGANSDGVSRWGDGGAARRVGCGVRYGGGGCVVCDAAFGAAAGRARGGVRDMISWRRSPAVIEFFVISSYELSTGFFPESATSLAGRRWRAEMGLCRGRTGARGECRQAN